MGNADNPFDEFDQPDSNAEEESLSLDGRGWDILVGGEEHAHTVGGEDPFDSQDANAELGETLPTGESPFGAMPSDAFYDRGRGEETPVPPEISEAATSQPPRDLSPQDMGRHTPMAVPTQPDTVDMGIEGFETPPVSLGELTTPPAGLPADLGTATQPATPFASEADVMPFGSRGISPFETPAPGTGTPTTPAKKRDFSRPYDPFEEEMPLRDFKDEYPPKGELEKQLITRERIDALWDEINETYATVIDDVRGHFNTTETAITDLKKARELLLAGEEHFDNAEEIVKRVKARLRLETKVRQWSRTQGTWLAIYLVVWLLLLFTIFLSTNRINQIVEPLVPNWLGAALLPGLFGSVGGVVGALWVLIKHIARKRDFDPIHAPWYIINPFMGMALGIIAYFLLFASSTLLGADTPLTLLDIEGGRLYGLYGLCVVIGFNQNVLWALVDRVTKAIVPPEETVAVLDETTR
nr:hypothetical protein [Anaerolineae bacterium]